MSLSQDQVVDYIKNLKLGEVKALIETLEEELGVKASAPVVAAAAVSADGGSAEAQTEFDVMLTEVGAKKIGVIKVVRQLTGLGLKEAKTLVDNTPAKVKEAVSKEDADAAKASLEEAGASVELK